MVKHSIRPFDYLPIGDNSEWCGSFEDFDHVSSIRWCGSIAPRI
jgi:hypothetical protein